METPSWLYKEMALGNTSSRKIHETEKLGMALTGGAAAMMIGTALASPVLAAAGAKGAERMMDSIDRMTFDRDLKKVLDVNKDIGKPNDKQIRLAYQSIRTTNPKFSKDPLIAGTLLRQIMQNKVDPYDPKSPARVDLNIASQLSSSAGRGANDFVMQAAAESMGRLPGSMLQANADLQAAADAKAEADRNFNMKVQQQSDRMRTTNRQFRLDQDRFKETQRQNRMTNMFSEYGTGPGGTAGGKPRKVDVAGRNKAKSGIRNKYASASNTRARLLGMMK